MESECMENFVRSTHSQNGQVNRDRPGWHEIEALEVIKMC